MVERTINDEFDFAIGVPCCVTGRFNVAEIHTIVPPHNLSDDQISLCWKMKRRNTKFLKAIRITAINAI